MIVLTGQWNRWIRLSYLVAPEPAACLIPEGLELAAPACSEIHVAELSRLRPEGLPEWCGIQCCLVLTCLQTRLSETGEPVLYCLRIDADPRIVAVVGSLAQEFCFYPADFSLDSYGSKTRLCVNDLAGSGSATLQWEAPILSSITRSLTYSSRLLSGHNQGGFLLAELPLTDAGLPLPLSITNDRWSVLQQFGLREARRIEASLRFPKFECSWIFGHRRVACSSACLASTTA